MNNTGGAVTSSGVERSAADVAAIVRAGRHRRLIAIDGPSGSGKSTLADSIIRDWNGSKPTLVRLDDVYPGWQGLERAAVGVARTLVAPRDRGMVGAWRRWDWASDAPGAIERVRPGGVLIIEGCGAFAAAASAPSALLVWVTAPDLLRKRRALDRDEGRFDAYWDMWDRQWRRHVRRTDPALRAAITVHPIAM